MNIEDVHEMGMELESWIRLRLHAVAVKMLKIRGAGTGRLGHTDQRLGT